MYHDVYYRLKFYKYKLIYFKNDFKHSTSLKNEFIMCLVENYIFFYENLIFKSLLYLDISNSISIIPNRCQTSLNK